MRKERLTAQGIPVELAEFSIPHVREDDLISFRGLEVYVPRAFKATTMMVGNKESDIALCTGWTDPWQVVSRENIENFSIAAPLRTPMGINVLLWNLAKSPQIRHLAFWAGSGLDATKEGMLVRGYLESLWTNGLDANGKIKGTEFKLLPELVKEGGIEVIKKIISSVSLYNWSGAGEKDLAKLSVSLEKQVPYMEPHRFPEFRIEIPETFPSEETSLLVREEHLFDGWASLLEKIVKYGRPTALETGGAQVKELEFARVVIEAEDVNNFHLPPWIEGIAELKISKESLDWYFQNRILPQPYMKEIYPEVWKFIRCPKDPAYLYSELMFAFPRSEKLDQAVFWVLQDQGLKAVDRLLRENYEIVDDKLQIAEKVLADDGLDDPSKVEVLLELFVPPVNQVAKLIERLRTKPDDADKTLVLWDQSTHGTRDRSRPCLVYVALLAREGKLDMETIWRSHDIAKGWPENLYGMLRLQRWLADQTGFKTGHLIASSQSAHIYLNDLSWATELLKRRAELVRPSKVFRVDKESDPRGNVVITVDGKQIVFILHDPKNSTPILQLKGTYKDIFAQLKSLDLLSKAGHMIDIGSELQKAEISRLTGLPYIQDKPIDFKKLVFKG